MPQGRAALVGEEVHGDGPPVIDLTEDPVQRHEDVVEEDLAEFPRAVHRLNRPDGDAGAVHVDEQGGDAPVRRLGRSGARQEHAALRVLGQTRPHLLAVDPPAFVRPRRPAGERGQVAPGPRLREALAPDLVAAQEPGHHLGCQGCWRVVDHCRREDFGHGVDAGLHDVARRERLPEVGAEEVASAQSADAFGPPHAHEAGVVGQPQHLAELCHLLVEGPDPLVGRGELPRVRVQPVIQGCLEVSELHRVGSSRWCRPRGRAGSDRAAFRRRAHRYAGGRSWSGSAAASPARSAGTSPCSSRCACRG